MIAGESSIVGDRSIMGDRPVMISAETCMREIGLSELAVYRGISVSVLHARVNRPGVWRDHFFKIGNQWRTTPYLMFKLDTELAKMTKASLSR